MPQAGPWWNPPLRRAQNVLAACRSSHYPLRMDCREAFVALNLIEGVGPVRARSLLEHFGEAPKVLAASKSARLRVRNIGDDLAEKISAWEKTVDLAGELKRISDFGCHVLIGSDENYPPLLREIYDPPLVKDVTICKTNSRPQKSNFQ
jgi:DNA processing protein